MKNNTLGVMGVYENSQSNRKKQSTRNAAIVWREHMKQAKKDKKMKIYAHTDNIGHTPEKNSVGKQLTTVFSGSK